MPAVAPQAAATIAKKARPELPTRAARAPIEAAGGKIKEDSVR